MTHMKNKKAMLSQRNHAMPCFMNSLKLKLNDFMKEMLTIRRIKMLTTEMQN